MKRIIKYNDIIFDSEEERLFYLYLEELKINGFVKNYSYHTDTFILSETVKYVWAKNIKNKTKNIEGTLLHGHIYTPDFKIVWNNKAKGIFYYNIDDKNKLDIPFIGNQEKTYVEIKPSFDRNNMQRLFAINQKWVYDKYGIYVQKIIPVGNEKCLFAKTFVPQKATLTAKTKVPKKYRFKIRSFNEFIGGKNE